MSKRIAVLFALILSEGLLVSLVQAQQLVRQEPYVSKETALRGMAEENSAEFFKLISWAALQKLMAVRLATIALCSIDVNFGVPLIV